MPYKDKERERKRTVRFMDSARFADKQISYLKAIGITHTYTEWRQLRRELIKSKLKQGTIESLALDGEPHYCQKE